MSPSDIQSVLSLGIALFSLIGGITLWYKGSVEKRYAAESDFRHIKRNYEQQQQALTQIFDEIEDLNRNQQALVEEVRKLGINAGTSKDIAVETKALMTSNYHRLEAIAARLDSTTSGWMRRTE